MVGTPAGDVSAALKELAGREVQSLLVEGGSALHTAFWSAGLVDYVQMYVSPDWLGTGGVPMMAGCDFTTASLVDRRVDLLGPDVLIEGYVHRPH